MRVLIIGAGGHAQVVADILLSNLDLDEIDRPLNLIGYLDDDSRLSGKWILELPVLGVLSDLSNVDHDGVIVAIGNNEVRQQIFEGLRQRAERFITAIHPSAVIASDVKIGPGSMICAGVVINTGATVGANTILNTGCTIDHHSIIGDHVHVAPGAHLGGEVRIGTGVLVGIGATVMPRCKVGAWSIVGAGALVHRDLPSRVTAVGIPAKIIKGQIQDNEE